MKENEKLQILYEDKWLLVCVKPPGTAVQTRRLGEPDMVSLLRSYRASRGEPSYIGLVHRLDQPVEGILVFGKDQKTTGALSRQLSGGSFTKRYLAVTRGEMPQQEGTLVDYLKKDGKENRSRVVLADEPGAKRAELHYQVIKTTKLNSGADTQQNLVQIDLKTGRHHQIRVQLAHLGTPIVGDRRYGSVDGTSQQASGLMLCAMQLEFSHPKSGEQMSYQIQPSGILWQKI